MKDKIFCLLYWLVVFLFVLASLALNLIIYFGKAIIDFSNSFFDEDGRGVDTVKKTVPYVIMGVFTIFVLDIIALFFAYESENDSEGNQTIGLLGTFGDFFGGTVNPILTFLTFIGLLITIALQRKELHLTREELRKSAEEQAKSANAANRQVAESSIFNLINLNRKIFSDISFESQNGLNAFNCILEKEKKDGIKCLKSEFFYFRISKDKSYIFGPYFGTLHQVFLTIDSYDSDLMSDFLKRRYVGIVRSYLSLPEITLLSLNCLNKVSDDGEFKEILIKYEFFKYLSIIPVSKETCNKIIRSTFEERYNPKIRGILMNNSIQEKNLRESMEAEIRAFKSYSKNYYLVGNHIYLPDYFLYEYIIESESGECIASAFGGANSINSEIIKTMRDNNYYQDTLKSIDESNLYGMLYIKATQT